LGKPREMQNVALPGGVVCSVLKCDEAVRIVPIEVRRDQSECHERNDQRPPATQSLTRVGGKDCLAEHAEREVDHGVFGKQPGAYGETKQHCALRALALEKYGPEVERDLPKKEEGHVGGDRRRKERNDR